MNKNKSLVPMLPLFLVLFIDGMGLGLLFPILNVLLIDPNAGFLPQATSELLRSFYYGLTIGIFMLCWFLGAAILGDLSDSIGRKKSLMVCLIGSFLGYILSAIALLYQSIGILLIGRVIAGFTAGSQPIAQAAIVDVSTEEKKPRNIGFILLSISLGFVCGPIIGGILSNSEWVGWFDYAVPMYFAAALSLFDALILQLMFKETLKKTQSSVSIQWHRSITIFISAFKHPTIKHYSIVLLVMVFGWSNYFSFIPLYLLETYHYTVMQNSLYLAFLGLGFSIGCGYATVWFTKNFEYEKIVISGLGIAASQVLLVLLNNEQWILWMSTFVIGISLSVAYSTLLTIFSNQVSSSEQGWVMGVTGSIMALCFGLTSVFTGLVAHIGAALPMLLAFFGLLLAAILLFFFRKRK